MTGVESAESKEQPQSHDLETFSCCRKNNPGKQFWTFEFPAILFQTTEPVLILCVLTLGICYCILYRIPLSFLHVLIDQRIPHKQEIHRPTPLMMNPQKLDNFPQSHVTDTIITDVFSSLTGWQKIENTFTPNWNRTETQLFGEASLCFKQFRHNPIFQPYFIRVHNATVFRDGAFKIGNRIYQPPLALIHVVPNREEMYSSPANVRIHKGFLSVHPFSHVYFHMLIELFPTIWRLFRNGNPDNVVVLFYKHSASLTDEIFRFFNVSFIRYANLRRSNVRMLVDELSMIQPRGMCEWDHVSLQMLRDWYLKHRFNNTGKPRFFFLKHFRNRKIINEAEMLKAIKNKYPFIEFEVPILAGVEHQARQFQNCFIAMGAHGSAFANALWMPPGSVIIEFTSSSCYDAVYDLATIIGLKHFLVRFPNSIRRGPITVDIPMLLSVFEKVVPYLNETFHCF